MSANQSGVSWVDRLEAAEIAELGEIVRTLSLKRLQRLPLPKTEGFPFGHELRIARRFLTGRCSSLDPSAFSSLYARSVSPDVQQQHHAFVLGAAMPGDTWHRWLGASFGTWRSRGWLLSQGDQLRMPFRLVPVEGTVYAVDPLDERFANRVHLGQDSLNFVEFLRPRLRSLRAERALDVGVGSGVVLTSYAPQVRHGVGVDINPRAVRVARANTGMNRVTNCEVEQADVFGGIPGGDRFDLVTWNIPFMFYPPEQRDSHLDGDGGHLGTELTLRFVELLPALLASRGSAFVMTAAPVFAGGHDGLMPELQRRSRTAGLEGTAHVRQSFWVPRFQAFHREHGIRRFWSVILELRKGSGGIRLRRPEGFDRAADWSRVAARQFRPLRARAV